MSCIGTTPSSRARCLICSRRRPLLTARAPRWNFASVRSPLLSSQIRPRARRRASGALFLGNTPDHPVNFFGALKAGARVAHLSPLDGEIALTHKVSDSGSRLLVTSNLQALLPTALKFLDKGLIDRLVVCEDDAWGKAGTPQAAIPDDPRIVTFKTFVEGAPLPAQRPVVTAADVALLH